MRYTTEENFHCPRPTPIYFALPLTHGRTYQFQQHCVTPDPVISHPALQVLQVPVLPAAQGAHSKPSWVASGHPEMDQHLHLQQQQLPFSSNSSLGHLHCTAGRQRKLKSIQAYCRYASVLQVVTSAGSCICGIFCMCFFASKQLC